MSTVIKRLSWALALSVGVNLFLLGFGATRAWRMHAPHAEHGRPGLMRMLGPPTPELRAQHDQLTAARKRVGAALEAEPYDRARAARALEELRDRQPWPGVAAPAPAGTRGQAGPEQRHQLAAQRFTSGPATRRAMTPALARAGQSAAQVWMSTPRRGSHTTRDPRGDARVCSLTLHSMTLSRGSAAERAGAGCGIRDDRWNRQPIRTVRTRQGAQLHV